MNTKAGELMHLPTKDYDKIGDKKIKQASFIGPGTNIMKNYKIERNGNYITFINNEQNINPPNNMFQKRDRLLKFRVNLDMINNGSNYNKMFDQIKLSGPWTLPLNNFDKEALCHDLLYTVTDYLQKNNIISKNEKKRIKDESDLSMANNVYKVNNYNDMYMNSNAAIINKGLKLHTLL